MFSKKLQPFPVILILSLLVLFSFFCKTDSNQQTSNADQQETTNQESTDGNTQEEVDMFENIELSSLLPDLPYAANALEPYISERTLNFHYKMHHNGYAKNLENLIQGTDYADMEIKEIIQATAGMEGKEAIFNNASQIWNHDFFWHCMKPNGGGDPPQAVLDAINSSFGSLAQFKDAFKSAAGNRFGSGYAWIIYEDGQLKATNTLNADNPIAHKQIPIMTVDVWEHAYYLDYQNRRGEFVGYILEHLINWDFVAQNLSNAQQPTE